jgi:intracellular multiplication protein IcmK
MDIGTRKNMMLFIRISLAWLLAFLSPQVWADDPSTSSDINIQAFQNTVTGISPLSDDQIKEVRKVYNSMNRAMSFTDDVPPTPLTSAMTVDLSTGATPPVIRLAAGYITSVVFTDATGEPWPIKAYDIGNPSAYNIVWNQSDTKGQDTLQNTLMIQSMVPFQEGNLAVIMKGLNTPIMFTLIPGQRVVDYRIDVRVPKLGPDTKVTQQSLSMPDNGTLQDVLNNIAPAKSKVINLSGGNATGWVVGKKMYIRTPLTILSPAYQAVLSGSDGFMKAYELQKASVILASWQGKYLDLKVEDM